MFEQYASDEEVIFHDGVVQGREPKLVHSIHCFPRRTFREILWEMVWHPAQKRHLAPSQVSVRVLAFSVWD